jgi:3-hydroxyacyl-[acyl-carrier-protein] dehydratase
MTRRTEKKTGLSLIARQIEEAMEPLPMNGAGAVEASFSFGEDFSGFQGHFPSRKVFPGVCQLQCVLALLGRWQDADARLAEITNVKYVLPIFPGDVITCKITNLKDLGEGVFSLKASILKGSERVSDFRLKARLGHSQDS